MISGTVDLMLSNVAQHSRRLTLTGLIYRLPAGDVKGAGCCRLGWGNVGALGGEKGARGRGRGWGRGEGALGLV